LKSLILILLVGGNAAHSGGAQPASPRTRSGEWFLVGGYGATVEIGPTRTAASLALLAPQWSLPLTRRVEYVVEGSLNRYFAPSGYFGGLVPFGARISAGSERLRYHFSAGAGLGWTDLTELPEIDRRFNFLLQGGLGVRWNAAERGDRFVELRLVHLSNGGTAGRNLGLNSLALVGGWRIR
jgi:lipid A 3-O-deacylase PagL